MRYRRFGIALLACLLALGLNSILAHAAVNPQKIFAIAQSQVAGAPEVPGVPSDSILFYDVTSIGADPNASGVFNNAPLFSVWVGFEIFDDSSGTIPTGNREDISALTFNPANGTVYALGFDSGTQGFGDPVGDIQGDWDLYRINYQAILNDYVTNSRPQGTIYAPAFLSVTMADEQAMRDSESPYFDGTVDGLAHNVPHPSDPNGVNTVHLPENFEKIGQLARAQTPASFFDHELEFVNPETLVALEANSSTTNPSTSDFNVRVFQRVATVPDQAQKPSNFPFPVQGEGGWRNGTPNYNPIIMPNPDPNGPHTSPASESWESRIAAFLQLDPNSATEPAGWAFVNHNGTLGVWVADSDNGGDDIAFYDLDLSDPNNPVATKRSLLNSNPMGGNGNFLGLADNPDVDATTNDGEVDNLMVDKNGNLVIIESGFFDTDPNNFTPPTGADGFHAEEPKTITIGIADYDNSGVVTTSAGTGFLDSAAYQVSGPIPVTGAIDNDDEVTNTTKVAYDKSTGYVYIIDQDTHFNTPGDPNSGIANIFEDIYVFDPASGTIVYHEFSPFDIGLFNTGTQIVFTRGDINGDGEITYADVKELQAGVADPTLGGAVSASVGAEWYDLTGDAALDGDDITELVEVILGTALGDFNLDGEVSGLDFLEWQTEEIADFDGGDLADWETNYGFTNMPLVAAQNAVPEPSTLMLLCLGLGGLAAKRRHR